MEQLLEKSQYILIEDIKRNPEVITQFLFKDIDVSILFEKQGDKVRLSLRWLMAPFKKTPIF